jgi:hypothetical protein
MSSKVRYELSLGKAIPREEMEKIQVEVTGASGVFKVPLTRFVYKGDWKQEDVVPKKPEKGSGFTTILVLLGITISVVVGFFLVRKYFLVKTTGGQHELDSLDKTAYSMVSGKEEKSRNSDEVDEMIMKKRR